MTTARFTHVGGPTVLIEAAGWRILTDPTFDPPGKRYRFGWGSASTKTAGPAVPVEEIGPVDLVLLSHDHHADNLDDAGRALLASVPVVLTTEPGARRLGAGARPLAPWSTTTLDRPERSTIKVVATPCRHGPPGSRPIVGEVIGFALQWEGQKHGALWISGDTVLYDGVKHVADRLAVGTAVLHLGGVRFPISGPIRYSMTAHDAMELCGRLRPRTIVPVHYEGWSHFQEDRAAIDAAFGEAPVTISEKVLWLVPGRPADVEV